jgi:hypothetical protein
MNSTTTRSGAVWIASTSAGLGVLAALEIRDESYRHYRRSGEFGMAHVDSAPLGTGRGPYLQPHARWITVDELHAALFENVGHRLEIGRLRREGVSFKIDDDAAVNVGSLSSNLTGLPPPRLIAAEGNSFSLDPL